MHDTKPTQQRKTNKMKDTTLRDALQNIARLIAQDGELRTDGECLGDVWEYLETLGINPREFQTQPAPLQIASASSAVASPELSAALVDTRALAENPCNGGDPCGFGVYCSDQSGEWIETGFSDEAAAERFADTWRNYREDNTARVGLVISNDRAEWEEDTQPETIGARCVIEWSDKTETVYISLGEHNAETNCDTFGVPDGQVFYYADPVEFQRFTITDEWHKDGWRIVSYEWVTQ
jgi:hypothetical protein